MAVKVWTQESIAKFLICDIQEGKTWNMLANLLHEKHWWSSFLLKIHNSWSYQVQRWHLLDFGVKRCCSFDALLPVRLLFWPPPDPSVPSALLVCSFSCFLHFALKEKYISNHFTYSMSSFSAALCWSDHTNATDSSSHAYVTVAFFGLFVQLHTEKNNKLEVCGY